jgi:3-hydroxyacyl-CoA dehydrogenase
MAESFSLKHIGVAGLSIMGAGIAQVTAQAGLLVNYLLPPSLFDAARAVSAGLSTAIC